MEAGYLATLIAGFEEAEENLRARARLAAQAQQDYMPLMERECPICHTTATETVRVGVSYP